jgi:hypothetical protein
MEKLRLKHSSVMGSRLNLFVLTFPSIKKLKRLPLRSSRNTEKFPVPSTMPELQNLSRKPKIVN